MYKKWIQGKKAVTFDLDGTLAKTDTAWDQAYSAVLNSINASWMNIDSPGASTPDVWKLVLDNQNVNARFSPADLTEHTYREFVKHLDEVELALGFWDVAYKLKTELGLKLGLVSSTDRVIVDRVLAKLEVKEVFDLILGGNEVEVRKPDPQIYQMAAQKLGITPQEILAFEDSPVGALAAKKAGCDVVVVWDGKVGQSNYPEKILEYVPDFEGVAELLDFTFQEGLERAAAEMQKQQKEN